MTKNRWRLFLGIIPYYIYILVWTVHQILFTGQTLHTIVVVQRVQLARIFLVFSLILVYFFLQTGYLLGTSTTVPQAVVVYKTYHQHYDEQCDEILCITAFAQGSRYVLYYFHYMLSLVPVPPAASATTVMQTYIHVQR